MSKQDRPLVVLAVALMALGAVCVLVFLHLNHLIP